MNDNDIHIVGIGASAGGLEALNKMLSGLSIRKEPFAIIIAQHLSPDKESKMVELLNLSSNWKVSQAEDGIIPEDKRVYIVGPGQEVLIQDGIIKLQEAQKTVHPIPSVDSFFKSLAADKKDKSIGVILSGTGKDGSEGIKAIKQAGGYTIAQDPKTASYDGMPETAIRTGQIDVIIEADKMGDIIAQYVQNFKVIKTLSQHENSIKEIFRLLSKKTGTDFSKYKESTIIRRVNKRLEALDLHTIDGYYRYIKKNPTELGELFNTVLIGVTEFFRNELAFEACRRAFRDILIRKKVEDPIRVWSVGCATGEEPYSLAIMLAEILAEKLNDYKIQIFATDIDEAALQVARKGIYSETSTENIEPKLLRRYFNKTEKGYEIKKFIRQLVLFSKHDITADPPFVKLDLISCRNLLIYFKGELQKDIIPIFHYALQPEGYLLLGKSESIVQLSDLFAKEDSKNKLFKRKPGTKLRTPNFTRFRTASVRVTEQRETGLSRKTNISEAAKATIAETFEHPYMVINQDMEVMEVFGDLKAYTELTPGELNANITRIINKALHLEFRTTFIKATQNGKATRSNPISFSVLGTGQYVRIVLKPLLFAPMDGDYYVVIFERLDPEMKISLDQVNLDNDEIVRLRITELEQELAASREHVQTFSEELETSNEELQSLNEELQSANEELKSANEELETSNEELQSANEELQTANAELRIANETLIDRESDLNRSQQRLEENEAKLEEAQKIGKFGVWVYNNITGEISWTDNLYAIFELENKSLVSQELMISMVTESDRKRIAAALDATISDNALLNEVYQIRTGKEQERYLHTIARPYRNLDEQIVKVIGITMDITDSKKTEAILKKEQRKYQDLFSKAPFGICVVNSEDFRIIAANPKAYEIFERGEGDLISEDLRCFDAVEKDDYTSYIVNEELRKNGYFKQRWQHTIKDRDQFELVHYCYTLPPPEEHIVVDVFHEVDDGITH